MSHDFEAEALKKIATLRVRLAGVLRVIRHPGESPAQLARRMALERKLVWQVIQLSDRSEPADARYVPGAAGVTRFLKAAARFGATKALLKSAADADASLRDFQRRQARRRELFDAMLNGIARPENAGAESLATRRAAFRANAAIGGSQVAAQIITVAVAPNHDDPDQVDWMMLSSFRGFQRLRSGVTTILGRYSYYLQYADAVHHQSAGGSEPIEPHTAQRSGGVPAIARFCSSPMPEMRRERCAPTYVQDLLLPGGVGPDAAVNVTTGEFRRRLGYRWAEQDPDHFMYGARVRTPTATLVLDVWHERSLFEGLKFDAKVYSTIHNEGAEAIVPQNILPLKVSVDPVPGGIRESAMPFAADYPALLKHCMKRFSWEPKRFLGYRATLEYPILPSLLWLTHPLPPPPKG